MRNLPILAIALLSAPAAAGEAQGQQPVSSPRSTTVVEVSTGVEYDEGDYRTGQKIRRLSVPTTVRVGAGRLEITATVPYTRLDGPANVVAGGGLLGLPVIVDPTRPTTGRNRREGLGDVTAGASYQVPTSVVDLKASGEVKLPTASRKLGTGKTDYSVAAQASKTIGAVTPFFGVGYTMPGDLEGYSLRNSLSLTGGMAATLGARTRGFLSYSRGQSVNADLPDGQQVTAGVNTTLSDRVSVGAYGAAGLSKGSPDLGAGIRLGVRIK